MELANHLENLDELTVGLHTLRNSIEEAQQLVILLSGRSAEYYELIASVVENAKVFTLI